jgi:hypothetical protein
MESTSLLQTYKTKIDILLNILKSILEYTKENTIKEKGSDKNNEKDIYEEVMKFSFQIKFIKKSKIQKSNKTVSTEVFKEILNIGEYNHSDYDLYKKFFNKIIPYDCKLFNTKQKRNLLPKLKAGDKYSSIFGIDLENNEKKLIENNNGIQIFSFSGVNDYRIFKGTSRISTSIKSLRNTLIDDEELDNIQYNNIFILNESHKFTKEDIQKKLKNLNLFNIRNLNNYYISNEDFDHSKEYFSYNIDKDSEFYLIVNEKGIILYIGEFDETHKSLEKLIKNMIKIKNGNKKGKEKNKEKENHKKIEKYIEIEKGIKDFYDHEDKYLNFPPKIKEEENIELSIGKFYYFYYFIR